MKYFSKDKTKIVFFKIISNHTTLQKGKSCNRKDGDWEKYLKTERNLRKNIILYELI